MGPTPKPTTKTEMVTRAASSLMWNSSDTPAMSAVMTEEANATTKQVKATIMVQYHLNALDQFFGFAGSSTVNVTSLYFWRCPSGAACVWRIVPVDVSLRSSSRLASRESVRVGRVRSSSAESSYLVLGGKMLGASIRY